MRLGLEPVLHDRARRARSPLPVIGHPGPRREHALRKTGWSLADGDTSTETAANSPGHKLRLTYSTAADDLQQIDLGQIARPRPITLALSNSMFDRAAAMSMMLEVGAS